MKINNIKKFMSDELLLKKNDDFSTKFNKLFLLAILLFIAAFVIQFLIVVFSSTPPYVVNSSVFHQNPKDSFADFFNVNNFLTDFAPYAAPHYSSYPPLNFIFALPFMLMQNFSRTLAVITYLICCLVALIIIIIATKKRFSLSIKSTILLIIVFLISAPTLFLFERGNYLFFTFFFVVMFLLFKNSNDKVKRELSLVCIAIASAMKIYPAIFSVFLLREKRFADFCKTVIYSILLFFLPFFMLQGGIVENVKMFYNNLFSFSAYERLSLDVSFKNILRIFAYLFNTDYLNANYNNIISVIKWTIFLFIIISIFLTKDNWKVLCLCAFSSVIIPHPAITHSLIFVFLGFIVFFKKSNKTKVDIIYALLFLCIITPLQFGYILSPVPFSEQYIGIALTNPNYLGLSVNTFIEGLAVIIFSLCIIVDTILTFVKSRKRI